MAQRTQSVNPMLFFGGLLIGSIAAALFTPKTGPELRRQLKENANKTSDNMKSKAEKAKEQARNTKDKAMSKLQKSDSDANDNQPPLPPSAAK